MFQQRRITENSLTCIKQCKNCPVKIVLLKRVITLLLLSSEVSHVAIQCTITVTNIHGSFVSSLFTRLFPYERATVQTRAYFYIHFHQLSLLLKACVWLCCSKQRLRRRGL